MFLRLFWSSCLFHLWCEEKVITSVSSILIIILLRTINAPCSLQLRHIQVKKGAMKVLLQSASGMTQGSCKKNLERKLKSMKLASLGTF